MVVEVRAAADRTVAAGTARLTMTTPAPQPAPDPARVEAASSTAPPVAPATETTSATSATSAIDGTVDFAQRRSRARVAMPPLVAGGDTVHVEMLIDGADLYLEVLGHPGRFVRTRLDEHGDGMPAGDPGLLLDWLRGCTEAALSDGSGSGWAGEPADPDDAPADLGDGALTTFDVVLDLDRAAEAAPEASRRAVRLWIDRTVPEGGTCSGRVALDPAGRVHRLTVRPSVGELDLQLLDHGAPLDIAVPDDDALVDPAELHELLPDLSDLPEPPSGWATS